MAKKTGSRRAGSRRLGSSPEVHAENFEQQHQGASESIIHARDAIQRGDCRTALESLVDVARHVGAAANEALAAGMHTEDSPGMGERLGRLRGGLSAVEGRFMSVCLRPRRK